MFPEVIEAGPALILQELGNLASVLIAMPLAILLGMRREAVGACSSISREPSLGVIGESMVSIAQRERGYLELILSERSWHRFLWHYQPW